MKVADFDFHLPPELLAEYPTEKRGASRLMLVDRKTASIKHLQFSDIPDLFRKDDILIRNTARVKAVRFLAKKEKLKGAKLEVLIIESLGAKNYHAFIDPLVKVRVGSKILFGEGAAIAEITNIIEQRSVHLKFIFPEDGQELETVLREHGKMPLPRYIKRKPEKEDEERYQTVYAQEETALAAPTSGLHFTEHILTQVEQKGVRFADINLEIGLGTFNPVYAYEIKDHEMHNEAFHIPPSAAQIVNDAKTNDQRVIALGTTSIRASEAAFKNDRLQSGDFNTDIFIYPPYEFSIADALITNFHTPRSTLLMLVSAFGGRELIRHAYEVAIKEGYRFYSYGDSMMIL